jgi:hypothetical protein
MYRVNYYVLCTLTVMVCRDYGCDDLYGLWLWWLVWTMVVMICMDYCCDDLYGLWMWISIFMDMNFYFMYVWMLYNCLIYTMCNDIYKITMKCCQNFQFSKVIRCLPVKIDGYRSGNIGYRSVNSCYRFFEFEFAFWAVFSGFRWFTAGLPIPLIAGNRFTGGKLNPGWDSPCPQPAILLAVVQKLQRWRRRVEHDTVYAFTS